eukprot:CAMPEP_0168534266 /NCGR_PEP_ID=MMETSP0405-20121227/17762_1 /TAXON_ID=498012 /ORGANISM="Trichosphaerium sp, Strain Am-I-7 wt" /LENGTH=59 /DNA_ID=CAMNT_0008560869 /DNA_START=1 /DNA_END=177 /DNA_ORIENTATION=+
MGYWNEVEHQRLIFDDIAKQLNVKTCADWYNVCSKDVLERGAGGTLVKYGKSFRRTLEA